MRAIARPVAVATFVGLLGAPGTANAQAAGSIRGTVSAREDRRPLPNARVSIAGAERAAMTNERGEYVIADVAAGTYTLRARPRRARRCCW